MGLGCWNFLGIMVGLLFGTFCSSISMYVCIFVMLVQYDISSLFGESLRVHISGHLVSKILTW
jgi:hypothetical protein